MAYYCEALGEELSRRVAPSRVGTCLFRVNALELLLQHVGTERGAASIPAWERRIDRRYGQFVPSPTQKAFMDYVADLCAVADANDCSDRMVHLYGDPGCGKTEASIQLAIR